MRYAVIQLHQQLTEAVVDPSLQVPVADVRQRTAWIGAPVRPDRSIRPVDNHRVELPWVPGNRAQRMVVPENTVPTSESTRQTAAEQFYRHDILHRMIVFQRPDRVDLACPLIDWIRPTSFPPTLSALDQDFNAG